MFHTSIDLDGEHIWAQRPTIDLLPVKRNKKKIFFVTYFGDKVKLLYSWLP